MSDDKMVSTAMAPIQSLIIGQTGTGNGMESKEIITPAGQPNVIQTTIQPILAIIIRLIDTFLTILVTLIGAGMTTNVIPAHDFFDLVVKCATLSIAGAGLGFLKDLLTLFTSLKQKFPLLGA